MSTLANYSPLRYSSLDGLALAARDYPGAGGPARLPVICIHGLTRNAADFDELAPLLAQTWARELAQRPGVHVVSEAAEITAAIERLDATDALVE